MYLGNRILNEHRTSIEFRCQSGSIDTFYYSTNAAAVQTPVITPANVEFQMLLVLDGICNTAASAADFAIDYQFKDGLLVFAGWYNVTCLNWITMGNISITPAINGTKAGATVRKFMVIPLNALNAPMMQTVRQWGYTP